jgi:hypothetical protein
MANYDDVFEAAGKQFNVDPKLLKAMMRQESSGNPNAVSSKGATGLMQLMPATAKEVGVTNPNDPTQNIMGGARYMSQMLDKFGDVPTALAAYNAGPGAVGKAGGIPNFPETQNYVSRITANYQGKPMAQQSTMPGLPPTADAGSAGDDPFSKLMASGGSAPAAAPAKGAPAAAPAAGDDPFSKLMASKPAAPAAQPAKPGAQPHDTTPLDIIGGAVEPIATMATGALGSLAGGITRLGAAALGSSYKDAQATGNKVTDALTYHPQTQGGQQALAGLGASATGIKNAVMGSPVGPALSAVGNAYDNTFVKGATNPLMATINDQVPTVTANLVAPAAINAIKGAPNALRAAIAKPAAVAERVEPSIGGQPGATPPPSGPSASPKGAGFMSDTASTMPSGAAPAVAGGRGSVGAAGTSFADQARAEGVPDHLVQRIAQQEQAGTLHPTAAERHIEAGSLPVPVELTAGQATGDINLLSHEQNIRGKAPELANRFNAQNGQINDNLTALRDKVSPDVTVPSGAPTGQAIVDAYKEMDAPVRQNISDLYAKARGADGAPALVDAAPQMQAFEQSIGPTRFNALPARVQQIFADAKANQVSLPSTFDQSAGSARPMSVADLMDIDKTLSGALADVKDGSVRHDIGMLRDKIIGSNLNPSSAGSEAFQAYRDAQAAARARFQAMDSDPAYKAAVGDSSASGEPSALADDFVRKYIAGGKTANVQNMVQNLANNPGNAQLVASGLMDHIRSQAGVDLRTGTGNISQAGLNKAIQNQGDKLRTVLGPDVSQTLERLGNVARYTQEQPRGSYVNNSNTFVAGAANAAKSAAEGAANVAAHGIPVGTWTRQALAKRALGKEAAKSLEPGAGLNKLRSSIGKN